MITLTKEDAFTIVDIISKAQEVIRCKDCKYSVDNDYCLFSTADMGEINKMDSDDFCSRGERKDE